MAGFVTNILGGQTSTPIPEVEVPGFRRQVRCGQTGACHRGTPPVKTMQWPPQKDSEASNG